MIYRQLNTFFCRKEEYVFLNNTSRELCKQLLCVFGGRSAKSQWPEKAVFKLDPASCWPGRKLRNTISNTDSLVMAERKLAELIKKEAGEIVEILPFVFYDETGRLLTDDYFIINPLTVYDCFDLKKCDVLRSDDKKRILRIGGIRDEDGVMLSEKKLQNAPCIFRVEHSTHRVMVSQDLLDKMAAVSGPIYIHRLPIG